MSSTKILSLSSQAMELDFTVSAGPLSQISVHLLSLETAMQLTTGL